MGTILLRVPMRNIARGPTWLHAILPQAVFTVMNLPYTFFCQGIFGLRRRCFRIWIENGPTINILTCTSDWSYFLLFSAARSAAAAAKKSKRNKSLDSHSTLSATQSDSEGAGEKGGQSVKDGQPDRKRHTSSGQQLRSLYDGLSHLYTDCDSR